MSNSPTLYIRDPRPEEILIIQRRFPQILADHEFAHLLVAERTDLQGTMAGWIALKFYPDNNNPEKAKFLFHVNQQYRRQGVGSALIDGAIEVAREAGARTITNMRPILAGSQAENFIKSKDFIQTSNRTTYKIETQTLLDVVKPTYQKLVRKNKLPKKHFLYNLAYILHKEDLIKFIKHNFTPLATAFEKRIRNNFKSFSHPTSPLIVYQNRIVGVALTTVSDCHATIDLTIVAKKFRNTWVNVALKYELARALRAHCVTRLQFGTLAKSQADSNRLLAKTNAQLLLNQSRYELAL